MTTLAGIDIPAPPAIVVPLFLLLLLSVAWLVARNISKLAARWLKLRAPAGALTDADMPKLSIPVAGAVLIGGLMAVVPELPIPPRVQRSLGHVLDVLFVLACALMVARVAVAAITLYAARNPS